MPVRVDPANPLDYGKPEGPVSAAEQKVGFELIDRLNKLRTADYPGDSALDARIKSYELAFRMQKSLPDVLDFSKETEETKKLYGIDQAPTKDFGMQMLAARRMVERGVRFVQVQHGAGGAGAWDAHGGLKTNHTNNCRAVDQPIAGLLKDLKRTGPQGDDRCLRYRVRADAGPQGADGRDHHIFGFCLTAGGGQMAINHGKTDEMASTRSKIATT